MLLRKRGIWKDQFIEVPKTAAEAMMQQDPSLQAVNQGGLPKMSGAQLQQVAQNALTRKPMDVPETENSAIDRQAGQLRAETDRMKSQTNLAKAQNEYDKSLQQLQQAQQPPQPQQLQPEQPQINMPQGMANITASEGVNPFVQLLKNHIDQRRANGRFASAQQISKPAPKTASERFVEIMEGKQRRPFGK